MSDYPSKADTDAAFDALRDAREAIERAQHALHTEGFAVEKLHEARQAVAAARQVASIADDFHKGRLSEKPYGWVSA